MRTDIEIVTQTNDLAREFYYIQGYEVKLGYDFTKATHPQEKRCWEMARRAQIKLTETDPNDALEW